MCLIAALLAVKMALTVAPRRLRFTRTVVRHKALIDAPSLTCVPSTEKWSSESKARTSL